MAAASASSSGGGGMGVDVTDFVIPSQPDELELEHEDGRFMVLNKSDLNHMTDEAVLNQLAGKDVISYCGRLFDGLNPCSPCALFKITLLNLSHDSTDIYDRLVDSGVSSDSATILENDYFDPLFSFSVDFARLRDPQHKTVLVDTLTRGLGRLMSAIHGVVRQRLREGTHPTQETLEDVKRHRCALKMYCYLLSLCTVAAEKV